MLLSRICLAQKLILLKDVKLEGGEVSLDLLIVLLSMKVAFTRYVNEAAILRLLYLLIQS